MPTAHTAPSIVAVSQATPGLAGRDAALERACELIVDAGQTGASLIIFPAAFIPGYPDWVWSITPGEVALREALDTAIRTHTVRIPSDVTDRLCRVARRACIAVVIGLVECAEAAGGTTIYNTLLSIDARGEIRGCYRASVSAGASQLIWTPAATNAANEGQRAPVTSEISGVGGI